MEQFLSARLNNLSESQTMAMTQKARDLKAQGVDVISLSVGEPDFFTPDHVKDAAKEAIDKNFSFYTPVEGYMDLREAIAKKLKEENNLSYTAQQIIVSNGAKHSLSNAFLALIDPGDEVIIPAPYWVSYAELVKLSEGVNVIIDTDLDTNFKITPQQLEAAITPKTKALVLCSPCNPTGSVYSAEELKALADVLAKYPRIFIIADEIYEYINFVGKHASIAENANVFDRCVIINGVSKAAAMTGWRIGYMAAPLWLTKACAKLQGQQTSNASSIAQRASMVALTGNNPFTQGMVEAFRRRRDLLVNGLREIPGIKCNLPDGAFYVFPDVTAFYGKSDGETTINDDMDMALYLLAKAYVATVPGGAFGDPRCIRLSYATSDENLVTAIANIKKALAALR
ncbi:MAG: pyridoxal phosphate-dependent aminotransferase [Bacteroidales bacterium]